MPKNPEIVLPPASPEITDACMESLLFTPSKHGAWGIPAVLFGDPGVGKSERVCKVAESCGLPVVTKYGSIHDPTDFAGVLMRSESGNTAELVPLAWAAELAKLGRAVLFLDELTTAPAAVQNAMLGIVLNRVIGELRLPGGIRVMAAANPPDQTVGGRELGPAQANRFSHWEARPQLLGWVRYMERSIAADEVKVASARGTAAEHEAWVLSEWSAAYDLAVSLTTTFVQSTTSDGVLDTLHKLPAEDSPAYGRAWPSPRSWELFTRALAGARIHDLGVAEERKIAESLLGPSVAASLAQWLAYKDLPAPGELLDGKADWQHSDDRPAATIVTLAAAVRFLKTADHGKRAEARAKRLFALISDLSGHRPDLAAHAIRPMLDDSDAGIKPLLRLPEFNTARTAALIKIKRTGVLGVI